MRRKWRHILIYRRLAEQEPLHLGKVNKFWSD